MSRSRSCSAIEPPTPSTGLLRLRATRTAPPSRTAERGLRPRGPLLPQHVALCGDFASGFSAYDETRWCDVIDIGESRMLWDDCPRPLSTNGSRASWYKAWPICGGLCELSTGIQAIPQSIALLSIHDSGRVRDNELVSTATPHASHHVGVYLLAHPSAATSSPDPLLRGLLAPPPRRAACA